MGGDRLPVVNGKQAIRALMKAGFILDRIVGSHHIMTFPGDAARTVSIPVHGNRDLRRGTLRSIIKQAGLTTEQFSDLL